MIPRTGVLLDGRYELTRRIAVGGMGEVWAATEVRTGREVAAKVLRPEFAGEQLFLERIEAEARNSALLTHPGIAQTYDHGEVDGLGYLVMELIEGEPLSAILARDKTLTPRMLLDILAQTADALAVAHAAGVVHRDIKPANLLIEPDGSVKLTDFGISLGTNQAPMTAAGMVMGTAQYLPPEQAMGKAATGAGDIYALGIIAYEALVGHRPYTGATQVDIAFAHVTEDLPPLPAYVDAPLRRLVESMLAKDPQLRPKDAAAVASAARAMIETLDAGAWDPALVAGRWISPSEHVAPVATLVAARGTSEATRRVHASTPLTTAPSTTAPLTTSPLTTAPLTTRRRLRRRAPTVRQQVVLGIAVVVLTALITLIVLWLGNLGASAAAAAPSLGVVLLRRVGTLAPGEQIEHDSLEEHDSAMEPRKREDR